MINVFRLQPATLRIPMWLRSRRPAPPPQMTVPLFPPITCFMYVLWFLYLVLAKKGMTFKTPGRVDKLWRCIPMSILIFLLARHELQMEKIFDPSESTDMIRSLYFTIPIAGFGMLLVSEIANFIFMSLGPRGMYASLGHPVISVHVIVLLYYLTEPQDVELCVSPCSQTCAFRARGRRVCARSTVTHPHKNMYVHVRMRLRASPRALGRLDVFGRPLHPLRYVMWTVSVSTMCLAVYLIAEGPLCHSKDQRTLSREANREHLINSLLGCLGTFGFGYAGTRVRVGGTLLFNATLGAASTLSFWAMLWCISTMLDHVIRDINGAPHGLRAHRVAACCVHVALI